jgi:hypothetical protein
MGVGAGRLPYPDSFDIILARLAEAPPILEGRATAVISLPADINGSERERMFAQVARVSQSIEHKATATSVDAAPGRPVRSEAVTAALALATRLAGLPGESGRCSRPRCCSSRWRRAVRSSARRAAR